MPTAEVTVLVVDDDPLTCELLQELLQPAGYRVETAENGDAALRRLERGDIDLMILDQMLPLVHGRTLCERIRTRRSAAYLPIIMLTALWGEQFRRAALAAGADIYLTKPCDTDELLYVVDRWAQTCERIKAAVGAQHSGEG
jgi:DNA-binding response OmpR family regulator